MNPTPPMGDYANSRRNDMIEERDDLASLCLTSKRLCDAAQPRLYRRVWINRREGWFRRDDEQEVHQALELFGRMTRTLLERPGLGRHVRQIKLDDICEDHGWGKQQIAADDAKFFEETLKKLAPAASSLPRGWGWAKKCLGDGSWESMEEQEQLDSFGACPELSTNKLLPSEILLPLLLSVTPNLRDLSLPAFSGSYMETTVAFGSQAISLPQLEKFEVMCERLDDAFNLTIITPLLRLAPNLRFLRVMHCGSFDPVDPNAFSHLRHLELNEIRLSAKEMDQLLASCGPLKAFHYKSSVSKIMRFCCLSETDLENPKAERINRNEVYPRQLVNSLRKHGHYRSLLTLMLDFSICNKILRTWRAAQDDFVVDTVGDFEELEFLDLEMGAVAYVEDEAEVLQLIQTLPESLYGLGLHGEMQPVWEDLRWLADQFLEEGFLVNLGEVALDPVDHFWLPPDDDPNVTVPDLFTDLGLGGFRELSIKSPSFHIDHSEIIL